MKLSIRIVVLLAGLAAGSRTQVNKRQTDPGPEALAKYCRKAGFGAGVITPINKNGEVDQGLSGSCLKKEDPNSPGPSLLAGIEFCIRLGREFNGAGGPTPTADHMIWCAAKAETRPEHTKVLAVLKEMAESGDAGEDLENFVKALLRDAPETTVGIYNALKAPPSSTQSSFGLGGSAGAVKGVVVFAYDWLMINVQDRGLFGPRTKVGKFLRSNIKGVITTPISYDYDTNTQLCVPFKDKKGPLAFNHETGEFFSDDVKRCFTWHDKEKCDTSYAYDGATKRGKLQRQICDIERNEGEQWLKNIHTKEAQCLNPQVSCSRGDQFDEFWYCMEDDQDNIDVCRLNGGGPGPGRRPTYDDEQQRAEALCFKPERSCRNQIQAFQYCMDATDASERACELEQVGWYTNSSHLELSEEKKQELQKEADRCFSPMLGCVNSFGQFLYCMDDSSISLSACRRNKGWDKRDQPKRSDK